MVIRCIARMASEVLRNTYSISSGPDESSSEVHIRALGDHTKTLLTYLKHHPNKSDNLWLRIDGPYGNHRFNYRRYPVLLLCAGGIGITPIVSICKDIYRVGDLSRSKRAPRAHAIEAVYVVWVIPEECVYQWFAEAFDECWRASAGENMPLLSLWIYVTRSKRKDQAAPLTENQPLASKPAPSGAHPMTHSFGPTILPPDNFQHGKPDYDLIAKNAVKQNPNRSTVSFACGPQAMVNAVWDASTQQKRSGHRVDFYHEVFDW